MEQLRLPLGIVDQGDAMRLNRELGVLDDFFVGAAARKAGTPQQPPKTTRLLEQLAELNGANLLDKSHRAALKVGLDKLLENAPVLHMSFASEPTPKSVEPILEWFRQQIHPQALLQVGVAPSIAAGCVLRTPNKFFDMSIRVHLQKQAHLLNGLIAGVIDGR
jgi:F0F1-type ATP synthase delta subunit